MLAEQEQGRGLAKVTIGIARCKRALAAAAFLLCGTAWAADPQISSFIDNPDPVPAGGNVTYTATVRNSALDDAANVVITVPVPTGSTFVSATAPCAPSGGSVVCALGTVLGSDADVRAIDFVFRATGPGPTSITATATLTGDNDTNSANNVQAQTTTVVEGGNLALAMTGAPDPVVGGSTLTYTLTASNAGPNASGNIVVTDNLPPAVTYASSGGTGWSCSAAGSTVTCSHPGPHAVGAPIPALTISGIVTAAGGTVTNTATVAPAGSGGTADPDNSDNTASVSTSVLPGADVYIAQKTVTSVTPAIAGQPVTFQIQPRNGGPATAVSAVVTDALPGGWTYVSASGPNWSCGNSGNTVTCTRASFPAGATDNLTVVATAPGNASVGPTGATFTNTASISSASTDPNTGNNSGSVNVTVLPDGADLRIAKTTSPNPVALNGTLTSTIRVTNNGPRVATGTLRVVEQLNGETYVSASGAGWTCNAAAAPTIVCDNSNGGGLAVNASLPDLVITSTATSPGTVSNTACTGSSLPAGAAGGTTTSPPVEGDANNTNDCVTASSNSTTVRPDVGIAKTTSTPTGGDKIVSTSEGSVTYTLVVSNLTSPGTDAATGLVINDTVPAFIGGRTTINAVTATASAGTATFSCAISGATVTCTQTGGSLLPGQTVTVPITVNRPMLDGSFTNTATVFNNAEGDPNASNNSASDTVQIDPIADVRLTGKTASPAAIRAGEQTTYTIAYDNNGPSTANGVVVTDTFTFPAGDSGLTVVSFSSSKGSCTAGGSAIVAGTVFNAGNAAITCAIGTMANAETQSITIVARANFQSGNGVRSFANTAAITTTSVENPAGGDNGNNSQSATLAINPSQVDLLTNTIDYVDPVPFAGNAFIDYRVLVTSNGPSYATNVRITETNTPPAGKRIRFVCDTTGPASTTCNPTSLCSVTNVTSAAGTALTPFTCDVPAGNATTGIGQRELASGQSKPIYLRFEVLDAPAPSGDVFNNSATVSANEPDGFAGNDNSTEQTTVRQRIDLAVAKSVTPATATLRQPFTWTVTVTNNGPGQSQQTDLNDTLPAGVVVTGPITWSKTAPAATGTCSVAGTAVSCSLGVLDSGGVVTISVPARADAYPSGGTLTNTATVDTDPNKIGGIDPVSSNNSATSTVTITRSSLTGIVFQDRDRAGANAGTPQAAASEPRIAGVTVTLTGTDNYGNAVSATTTSDGSGAYLFNDLPPSNGSGYTITETQPAGFVNSPGVPPATGAGSPSLGGTYAAGGTAGNSSFAGIAVGGNVAGTDYNFPEVRQPSLSGFVYVDMNLNGVRDAGTDLAVSGATVRLLNATTLAVIATTTTDGSGAYSFASLDPFTAYTLEEPLPATPANLKNGAVNPGLVNGAACASGCTAQPNAPAADTDRIAAIDLSAGTDGTVFNFGEQQQTVVSGLVFVDANRNSALDGSDTGRVQGVTIRLVQGADCTSGTTLQTTTSAADGTYAFVNVLAFQNYLVCETQPAGYGTGSANGTPNSNVVTLTNLASAGSANNNFGETLALLSGSVYQDTGAGTFANFNNGTRDAGEAGIVNVPVTLTGTDQFGSAVSRTVSTDASGNYSFDGLFPPNGSGYTITEGTIPTASGVFLQGKDAAGTAGGSIVVQDVISGIAFAAGTVAPGYLFGELPNASIAGVVYVDRNRNNAIDATPTDGRIGNVTLRLVTGADCTSGTTVQTQLSLADGSYAFANVPGGGNYLVCETQPAGYANGIENPGTSATTPGTNVIAVTNLPSTGSAADNFGERVGSIAGAVYQDYSAGTPANTNNGLRDAGELGIANVPVTLTGHDISGAAVSLTTSTDASGNYVFGDLLQSDASGYTIAEGAIPPASGTYNDGKDTAGTLGASAAIKNQFGAVVLPAGNVATGYLFGELPIAPISGTVYVDRNRNGTLEPVPVDGRIAGVTLTLRSGSTCAGPVLATTTSDGSGNYGFSGVSAGSTVTICETQPAGYADGTVNPGASATSGAANAITITNLPTAGSAGNHFGEQIGSLTGSVYVDYSAATPANNNNGVRDAGEAGIANVPVTLSGTDINGASVSLATTTDASGNYTFTDLLQSGPGGYTVTEGAIPAASGTYLQGKDAAGTAGGSIGVQDVTSGIVLPAGGVASGYLFGELPSATIAGSVYLDRNRNGTLDPTPTDGRIAGVTVRLVQGASCAAGTTLQTTSTAADGSYAFSGVAGGQNFLLCETQPAGYAQGTNAAGTNGALGATDTIVITNLPAAGSTGNVFGERAGSLAGNVFLDANDDGLRAGDAGIAGITITLSGVDGSGAAVNRTTTTDATGAWRFDDVLGAGAGGYTVTEQAAQPVVGGKTTLNGKTTAGPSGGTASAVATTPSGITSIALAAGVDANENNFAEILPVALAGTVFIDLNNNGVQNLPGDAGLAGVTIVVTGTDDTGAAVTRTVTTGADGSYTLPDLRPGTYTVTEPTQPAGTTNGQTIAGSAGGTATPTATTPSAVGGIVLTTPGASGAGYNFAEIPNSSVVSGRVWLDNDNNGVINGSEPGLAGVAIELSGTDLGGAAVTRTTVTDAGGNYSFGSLPPGNYTLREPTQPTGTLNGTTVAGTAGGTASGVGTTPSTITGISLGVGQTSSANNFGELPTASIGGHVIGDSNNNGKLDPGESGIANVTIVLSGRDDQGMPVSATTTTDAGGAYNFPGLRPGTYTVTEPTQPPGTVNGITTAGTVNGTPSGTATPPATTPSAVGNIVLPPGGTAIGNDFAEVGNSPDLLVSKASVEARFTVNNVGTYTVRVRNGGEVATTGAYRVADRLPAGLTLDSTPTGSGWLCVGAIGASSFTCTSSDVLAAGAANANAITVKVRIAAAALQSSPAINAVLVDGGGELPARGPSAAELEAFNNNPGALPACASGITTNACRSSTVVQAAASISGTVWYDIGSARDLLDGADKRLANWQVEIIDGSGAVVARTTTAADGTYRINDLLPGTALHVRFRDPASNVVWGYPVNGDAAPGGSGAACNTAQAIAGGTASSCIGSGGDPTLTVVLAAGQNLPQQSLPVDPSGVVYDSGTRQPVPGSVVTLTPVGACAGYTPATSLVGATLGGYTINGSAASMNVGVDGFYQFLFAPTAPASCTFSLSVAPPATYTFVSKLIVPATGTYAPGGAPGSSVLVQPQAGAPTAPVGPGTTYYLTFTAGSGSANILHNHLPLDPAEPAGLTLAKTGDRQIAEIGDTVRYTITVQRTSGPVPRQITVVDRLPAGFTFVRGTAVVGGVPVADPTGAPGPLLTFNLGAMPASGQLVLQYRVRVGVGAQQGDGVNHALGYGCGVPAGCTAAGGSTPLPGSVATNEGRYHVRVTGGVFTTEACVLGKIFVDCNGNHVQDAEEIGIPGVRLVISDGTTLISDSEGKYSYCGLPPRSHVMRVDESTLPRGSRLTTSSNRNLGDAGSLWLDLKNGELARADFIEGSCSPGVLEQVKARRAQGEIRSVETEKKSLPALRFDSNDKGPKARTQAPAGTVPDAAPAPNPGAGAGSTR